ncbi:hypothetical protein HPB49_013170 [Dermacentor silvarum]|uniref:Uncharacterized protein n=1 Tax=Dermacentor silvarum TaxID=543639 RepID=A0ACB8CRJ4_DERSI|nr:hypothetical protein HPB49_013170 [Dermacentor silvarum]
MFQQSFLSFSSGLVEATQYRGYVEHWLHPACRTGRLCLSPPKPLVYQTTIKRLDEWIKEYGNVFGFFIGDTPFMVVKDLDMINEIFIKESNKFSGRGHMFNIFEKDPLFAKYIILSKGPTWKSSRNCMSQFFTSSKLRAVMPSLLHAQQQFIDVLGEHADRGVEVDINSLCERFTFDVIGKAAYGIDTNVQRNPEYPLFKDALAVLPNVNSGLLYHLARE